MNQKKKKNSRQRQECDTCEVEKKPREKKTKKRMDEIKKGKII